MGRVYRLERFIAATPERGAIPPGLVIIGLALASWVVLFALAAGIWYLLA